ncbi:aspartic peptidase domain-containing protein [Trichoderma sp. SZMC 28012]
MLITLAFFIGYAASSSFVTELPNVLPLRRRETSALLPLTAADSSFFFDIQITIGGQEFFVLADTGSSDLWVVGTGYRCFNGTDNQELPQSACNYANATYSTSPTFRQIQNETLGVQYGAGIATGCMGTEDVTLGGVTVRGQEFGIADRLTNAGSGIDSGILGLAYPSLTFAHPTTSVDNTSLRENHTTYNPLFTNMFQQGSVAPWFSIAINRLAPGETSGPGGYLGLGEMPPINYSSTFASAPVEVNRAIPPSITDGKSEFTEWTLSVDAVIWGHRNNTFQSTNTTRFQAIVDSGGVFNELPAEVVDAVFAQYTKPPVLDPFSGAFMVDCDTIPPLFGLAIGGKTFFLLPEDMIYYNKDGSCQSSLVPGISAEGPVAFTISGPFLNNVVSVFDFGKNEMRFAARADGGGSLVYNNSSIC